MRTAWTYLCDGAYLLYDGRLHATSLHLHLRLEHHLLLGLDDVLGPIRSTQHLQDLTWGGLVQENQQVRERVIGRERG